ncbi:MAG: hypothetical protein ABSF94_04505 [Steroidobacteraceae bacterium]
MTPSERDGGSRPNEAFRANRFSVLAQVVALVLAAPAIAWSAVALWSTIFPPICGDSWGYVGLGVAESWLLDLPIGLLALAIGVRVKRGNPGLRRVCIGVALFTLALPIIASAFFHRLHCP